MKKIALALALSVIPGCEDKPVEAVEVPQPTQVDAGVVKTTGDLRDLLHFLTVSSAKRDAGTSTKADKAE